MSGRLGSIRLRLTAVAVATTAVIVVAFGWLLIELVTDRLVAAGEAELTEALDDVEGFDLVELGESGARYQIANGDYLLELALDDDGDLFVDVVPGDDPRAGPLGAFVIDTGTGEVRQLIVEPGGLSRDALRAVSEEGAETIIGISEDLNGERDNLVESTEEVFDEIAAGVDAVRSAAYVVGPLLILFSGLATWLLAGRALAPTRRIAAEAASIGTATLDRRVSRQGGADEVDTIARVINEMLDRIQAGVAREQQFVADASHELRTPLTTARMAAELAASDSPDSPYPPRVLTEVDRMQQLVDDLLRLATDQEVMAAEEVALDLLVAEVVDQHPAGHLVRTSLDGPVTVAGRPAELRRVVGNLVDNATRYADAVVEVTLAVEHGSDGPVVVLRVDDDGPGIPEAARERVFDRFVRLDEGRARDDGGSGLGLAIVRAAVERHGGTVGAGRSPFGGARLEVRLPTG
ncbi:MAG: HAMP domain-containing sensor histidine kinase [Actinomycetota bacterium]